MREYTVSEVAKLLHVHRNTVHHWIQSGEVKASRKGIMKKSPYLIKQSEIERMQRRMTR